MKEFFEINKGFKFYASKKEMDLFEAVKELNVHKQFYSKAELLENSDVILSSESYVCPYCRFRIPAYEKSILKNGKKILVNCSDINKWSNLQIDLWEKPQNKKLLIQDVYKPDKLKTLICPKCKTEAVCSEETDTAFIEENNFSFKTGVKINLEELFSVSFLNNLKKIEALDIFETLNFNLRNGHTFLRIENRKGEKLKTFDITNADTLKLKAEKIIKITENNKYICKRIKKFFRNKNIYLNFYEKSENDVQQFILLCRFQGYKKDFYNSIPFVLGSNALKKEFKSNAHKLLKSSYLPAVVKELKVPQCKSIRKIFFENPHLLFYSTETEKLWNLIKDINLFCCILKKEYIFNILTELHDYPLTEKFYNIYAKNTDKHKLMRVLDFMRGENGYPVFFMMLRKDRQQEEIEKWDKNYFGRNRKHFEIGPNIRKSNYSRPIFNKENKVLPYFKSNGYGFELLTNTNQYNKAANELCNCLAYCNMIGDVYGIKKGGKYVGAVEVYDGEILQKATYRNQPMENDENLYRAYLKWMNNSEFIDYDEKTA